MTRHDSEPATITADVVADYLERRRMYRMAEFVRDFDAIQRRAAAREMQLREMHEEVLRRLHKYETPAPPRRHEPVVYRSQWD